VAELAKAALASAHEIQIQTEGSQESCAPAMANGGKVLVSFVLSMAIFGEL
jgi:hypothetical protein